MIVLIDTWWNVNSGSDPALHLLYMVLIDTWWNVNLLYKVLKFQKNTVLIDTWWNVNVTCGKNNPLMETSFNRYMVECEFLFLCSLCRAVWF